MRRHYSLLFMQAVYMPIQEVYLMQKGGMYTFISVNNCEFHHSVSDLTDLLSNSYQLVAYARNGEIIEYGVKQTDNKRVSIVQTNDGRWHTITKEMKVYFC